MTAIADTTYGGSGLPLVTSKITIAGHQSTIERAITEPFNPPYFRLLAVSVTGDVTLQDLTLTKGYSGGDGGGVFNAGTLTLTNSSISGNGGPFYFGNGGGVYNKGTLTLTDSTVFGNRAYGEDGAEGGGGVFNTGTATLTTSTVRGNVSSCFRGISCDAVGGGLFNSGTLTLIHSIVTGNGSASSGGGIFNSGILALGDSTVSNNEARAYYFATGGGIVNSGTGTITNSTVSGNIVSGNRVIVPVPDPLSSSGESPYPDAWARPFLHGEPAGEAAGYNVPFRHAACRSLN